MLGYSNYAYGKQTRKYHDHRRPMRCCERILTSYFSLLLNDPWFCVLNILNQTSEWLINSPYLLCKCSYVRIYISISLRFFECERGVFETEFSLTVHHFINCEDETILEHRDQPRDKVCLSFIFRIQILFRWRDFKIEKRSFLASSPYAEQALRFFSSSLATS